ncbi:MAG: hypothetical protein ACYS6W_17500 [Planctomycetota bacterium]|jgi:hypothetical protein
MPVWTVPEGGSGPFNPVFVILNWRTRWVNDTRMLCVLNPGEPGLKLEFHVVKVTSKRGLLVQL